MGEGQHPQLVKDSYTQLSQLASNMKNINSDHRLDLQYLKEVNQWKAQCHQWLEKQAPQQLLLAQGQTLANSFFSKLAKAEAQAPLALAT